MNPLSIYERIYLTVKKIPKGQVATYGQIAALAGIPRQARQVGYALSSLKENLNVPWQRVVNAKGEISVRPFADTQRMLLEQEGVVFASDGKIDLSRFQWKPKIKSTPKNKFKD